MRGGTLVESLSLLEEIMIQEVAIEKKMQEAYLNYSLSVIIGRALPDVRDGLKPVHRRILYAARDLGLTPDKPHKKSARIVGEVLGKYHPHGDSAVYDAMVRMAQDFSQRYLLMDGHGNFGSIDGDSPAAMRYTEARLTNLALQMQKDIDQETVDFLENFDGTLEEPEVLPSRVPNLLINGSSGIAVGMSTSIPPHNLKEIIDGILFLVENPKGSNEDLKKRIQGPDFPTGGIIIGREGIEEAYETGKGRMVIRGSTYLERDRGKEQIIIDQIPYQVNKTRLLEEMAEMVKKNRIEHVSTIRDESDREGLRIVVELQSRASARIVLNNLFKHTSLQINYRLNFLTLVDRQPVILSLKELLTHFIDFRRDIILRRSRFKLKELEKRLHILKGLKIALDSIDSIIAIIKSSPNRELALKRLQDSLSITKLQADEILKMRLQRLVGLERDKLLEEMEEIEEEVSFLKDLLEHEHILNREMCRELLELKETFGDERKTRILEEEEVDFQEEDLIKREDLVISLSHRLYLKRARDEEYLKAGKKDFITHIIKGDTMDTLLFFTSDGQVHLLPCASIPEHHGLSIGDPLSRFVKVHQEKLRGVLLFKEEKSEALVTIATKKGYIKKTPLTEYATSYSTIKAINLEEDDEVVCVLLTNGQEGLFLATTSGRSLYCLEEEIGVTGRNTRGSRGIKLGKDDDLLTMQKGSEGDEVIILHEEGRGRRTPLHLFPKQKRYGKGLCLLPSNERPFKVLISSKKEDLLFVTTEETLIPVNASKIRKGNPTSGLYKIPSLSGDLLKDVFLLPRSKEMDYLS